jgi:hypothetical protein
MKLIIINLKEIIKKIIKMKTMKNKKAKEKDKIHWEILNLLELTSFFEKIKIIILLKFIKFSVNIL